MKFSMKILLIIIVIFCTAISAQTIKTDSIPKHTLTTVVVTANRFENQLLNSTSSLNIITNKDIRKFAVRNLADILQLSPGISVYNKDGLGRDPVVSARGFYGGGEAEYLTVMVDGTIMNDFESGLVNWNFIPVSNISKVEILNGGASALYGDAAIGGVINIITSLPDTVSNSVELTGGSYGTFNGGLSRSANFGKNKYHFYLSNEQTNGFRDNSKWRGTSVGGNLKIPIGNSSGILITTNNQFITSDDPGPLTETELINNRSYSSPYYKADGKDEKRFNLRTGFIHNFNQETEINFSLKYQHKNSNNIRTFSDAAPIIDPETFNPIGVFDTTLFGDTKERELLLNNFGLDGRLYNNFTEINTRILTGVEFDYGKYSGKYYNIFNGFLEDYSEAVLNRNSMVNDGNGSRIKFGAYLNSELSLFEPVKLVVGLRYDMINDNYDNTFPSDSSIKTENSAFSPKAGLNIRYADTRFYKGSFYLNYNESFKAPTVDQLTDLKPLDFGVFIPLENNQFFFNSNQFPPFANAELKPQKSRNYEFGTYQLVEVYNDLFAELSLSLYQTDIKDEIDFDLMTFHYQNISESRHRGLEGGLKFSYMENWSTFINYSYSDVTFRSGQYEGNRLKALPENILSIGLSYAQNQGFYAAALLTSVSNIYMDDENTARLPDYNYIDLRFGYKINIFNFRLDINNLLDKKFSTSGYLLNGTKYFFPAAGRVIYGGIIFEF